MNNQELIGDFEKQAMWVQENRSRLVKFAINHDIKNPEDVIQGVYLGFLQGRKPYHGGASYRTWFCRCMINRGIDNERRKDPRRGLEKIDPLDKKSNNDGSIISDVVEAKVDELNYQHKRVIVAKFYKGMSYKEIAKYLGLNNSQVRRRLYTARVNLRKGLLHSEARHYIRDRAA